MYLDVSTTLISSMESQPQNPEFRVDPENFTHAGLDKQNFNI